MVFGVIFAHFRSGCNFFGEDGRETENNSYFCTRKQKTDAYEIIPFSKNINKINELLSLSLYAGISTISSVLHKKERVSRHRELSCL